MENRSRLIRLASTMPVGSPERRSILAAISRQAGTLRYEGDTALDKVFACTDLLSEVAKEVPDVRRTPEYKAVQAGLFRLETVVRGMSGK